MQADKVTDAIATIGHSPNSLSKLGTIEAEIGRLDDRLAEMNQPRDFALSLDGLREFLCQEVAEIGNLLHGDVEIARQVLAKYVNQLILMPQEAVDGPFWPSPETSNFSTCLMPPRGRAAVMVAREGQVQCFPQERMVGW